MKRIIVIFYLLNYLLVGCISNSQQDYLDNLKPTKLTEKEVGFIEKLKVSGFKEVFLVVPDIGLKAYGNSVYDVRLFLDFDKNINEEALQDTLQKIGYAISNDLYTNIIEDSIIVDCSDISVSFFVNTVPSMDSHRNRAPYRISIDSLSKINNFKVVKIRKNEFDRIMFK